MRFLLWPESATTCAGCSTLATGSLSSSRFTALAFVFPPIERVRLDYAVIDRRLRSGAQDGLDIGQTLVAGCDAGKPVADRGALELREERLAKHRNDGV